MKDQAKNILIIALIILIGLFSSCVTQRKCNLKFPPSIETITSTKDSVVIEYSDTTIYVKIKGETKHDTIIIPCPPPAPAYIPDTVRAETSLAKAIAYWSYPKIHLNLVQKDTTIERRLDNALREIRRLRNTTTTVTITPPPVKYVPGFYKFCTFAFIGLLFTGVGYIVLRLFVFKK